MKPPTIVIDDTGSELQFDGVRQWRIEWSQVLEVAVEVYVVAQVDYSGAFWLLKGDAVEFSAPVELVVGSEEFNAILFALPRFDHGRYSQARQAEAKGEPGRFVCWKAATLD